MTRPVLIRAVMATSIFLAATSSSVPGADRDVDDWLRGSGKDLEIRLRGEVFEADGLPAAGLQVTGGLNAFDSNPQIVPTMDGHRFAVWIPVNRSRWYSLWLKAASATGDRVAYTRLSAYQLRQAAIDGITLTLRSPTREVDVRVVEGGQPVAGAWVKADLGFGVELRSRTDADGIARFRLLPQQKLSGLTAWTDDFRIGGFQFVRKPTRDPDANEQVVELSACRDQKLRFVDEDGSPVPGIDFLLRIATPPPDYNYIGTNEHSLMTVDAAGEVTYKWFPDWDHHHFYVELRTDQWILDGDPRTVDDAVVFRLKKSRIADRKRVTGRINTTGPVAGGFQVTLRSFQGERENYSDALSVFTDADGSFTVDVLPDDTYCTYVSDSRWMGEIIDLIPYQSESDRITAPELSVSAGQEVEVTVTSGPERRPYPNLSIHLRRQHRFTWREDGGTRSGVTGPQWWVTTDESGRATTRTLPGTLNVSVFTPLWRTEQTVDVRAGEPVSVRLHREIEEKRTVTGRLVLADGIQADLRGAEVRIGAVDGNYDDQQTVTCDDDGVFSCETIAAAIGVFGYTQDGRAAGSIAVTDLETPVELHLRPTMPFHGQLLGEGGRPLVDHRVRAIVRVEGDEDYNGLFVKSFEAKRIETRTDDQGRYTLEGIPSEMKVWIQADSLDHSERGVSLGEVYLEPDESRPPMISRMAETSSTTDELTLAERYEATLRDCSLCGFRLMLILGGKGDGVSEFIDRNFQDYSTNRDVYGYMQLVVSGQEALEAVDAEFLDGRNWRHIVQRFSVPGENRVVAYALDAGGRELGRLEIDVTDAAAVGAAAEFVHQHAPARIDAEKKWAHALDEAKRSHRRVWARVSQRYCGPCFRFARWLDDQRELLEKDYVMLKIDDVRDLNGAAVAERLTRGEHYGIPFHAIFDEDGEMLIDSAGPLGNIGCPGGFEGTQHLRKMLLQSRQNLTDDEIDQLVESIPD